MFALTLVGLRPAERLRNAVCLCVLLRLVGAAGGDSSDDDVGVALCGRDERVRPYAGGPQDAETQRIFSLGNCLMRSTRVQQVNNVMVATTRDQCMLTILVQLVAYCELICCESGRCRMATAQRRRRWEAAREGLSRGVWIAFYGCERRVS